MTTAGSMTDMMMRGGMPPASRGEQGKESRHNSGSPAPSTSTKSPKLALGHGNDKTPGFDESLEAKPRADQPQSDSNDESDFLNPNLGGNAGYWALKDKADALVIKVLKQ